MFSLINTLESFLIGICIGSFINVVIYRLPNNLSVISPRSFCPKCKNMIPWRENVPLLSWLMQRGKCNSCNEEISIKYPLIELFTGLIFILFSNSKPYLYSSANLNLNTFNFFENTSSWCFLSLLIVISFIDLRHFWIPQSLINFGFFFGFVNLIFIQIISDFSNLNLLIECLSASIFSYLTFELIRVSARYFYKRDALGKGDSKLVSMIALWLGPLGIIFSVAITYIFAAFYLLVAIKLKIIKRNQLIPFAPFLAFGGLSVWFFGNQLLIQNLYFY